MDYGFLGYIGLVLIAVLFILGLLSLITYFCYGFISKTKFKTFAIFLPILVFGFLVYNVYISLYPLDSFYRDDFKKITGYTLSNDAKIIKKDASYPDVHDNYCSCALIELDKKEFNKLLSKIKLDKSFIDTSEVGSAQFENVIGNRNPKYLYKMSKTENGLDYKFIGFLKDGKTIIIHLCSR